MSDDWETVVAAMLDDDRRANSRLVSAATLTFLASLVEKGQLPASGCAYVANVLRAVAEDDAEAILPMTRKKQRGHQPVEILAFVAREQDKHDISIGDAYDVVGRQLGLQRSTVAKMASQGRSIIRKTLRANLDAGADRYTLVEQAAKLLGVQVGLIEAVLKG